jgi:aspartate carbamoyltransferase catalytic subunit
VSRPARPQGRHLLAVRDLGAEGVEEILHATDSFREVLGREVPKVPALRGRTVATMFFEDSTRTRLSFETAAKRLSADTMTFSVGSSSVNKGESLRDTLETLLAMGVDGLVVRHGSSGAPWQVARWADEMSGGRVAVLNGGDGWHQHPTQALLDAYTVRDALGGGGDLTGRTDFSGLHVGIIGDVGHSRVARSCIEVFTLLGARVTLVAPRTLLPASLEGWPVDVSDDLDDVLGKLDVVYLLRLQQERMEAALLPSLREYTERFGLTAQRLAALRRDALVLHPGPMNRGVEIADDATRLPGARITEQVRNGVAVRMACLYRLLTGNVGVGE